MLYNVHPYRELEHGRLATLYAVLFEDYDQSKAFRDYDEEQCILLLVIFNDSNMPCDYENYKGSYLIGDDIYASGFIPIAFRTIDERIVFKDNES